jgi:hypothetical protein
MLAGLSWQKMAVFIRPKEFVVHQLEVVRTAGVASP